MLSYLKNKLLERFTVTESFTDCYGVIIPKDAEIISHYPASNYLQVKRKNGKSLNHIPSLTYDEQISYMNVSRCLSGISYTVSSDVVPDKLLISKGISKTIYTNTVLTVNSDDEIKVEHYDISGQITAWLWTGIVGPHDQVKTTSKDIIKHILKLENIAMIKNPNNTPQNPELPIGYILEVFGEVVDIYNNKLPAHTRFTITSDHTLTIDRPDPTGLKTSIVMGTPDHVTASEYIHHIAPQLASHMAKKTNTTNKATLNVPSKSIFKNLTTLNISVSVTDMFGQYYNAPAVFYKKNDHEVNYEVTDSLGNRSINTIVVNHPRTGSTITPEDYLEDIAIKHQAALASSVGSTGNFNIASSDGTNNEPDFSKDGIPEPNDFIYEPQKDTTPIKKVYCPYNADLIVYDISNKRVDELCGTLTEDKFYDLIARINDDTKFDGFEYFKCAVCELNLIKDGPQIDNDFEALEAMKEKASMPRIKTPNVIGGATGPISGTSTADFDKFKSFIEGTTGDTFESAMKSAYDNFASADGMYTEELDTDSGDDTGDHDVWSALNSIPKISPAKGNGTPKNLSGKGAFQNFSQVINNGHKSK